MTKNPETAQDQKKRKQADKRLRADFARVAKTPSGRNIFRYLLGVCGFQKHSVGVNPQTGEINTEATTYNEARRSIYVNMRQLIPVKDLITIEFDIEADEDEDDESDED